MSVAQHDPQPGAAPHGEVRGAPPAPLGSIPPAERLAVATADGLTLAAHIYGKPADPELLFVHGLNQCRLCWDRQVAGLADRFRIVTFDLRGHGDSDKPLEPMAYSQGDRWADDLRAVIDAARLRRPTVVGWSLGGLVIGLYLARHGASGLHGVHLVAPLTKQAAELFVESEDDHVQGIGSPDLAVRVRSRRGFLAACFARTPPAEDWEQMLIYNGMMPPVVMQSILPISGGERLDAAWAGVPRLLVSYGAHDGVIREAMFTRLGALNPRAKFSRHAEAGHAPFYEDAPRFNRELADFAAEVGG